MPTYDYQCNGCSKTFDVVKRLAELDRPEPCPACQSEQTARYFVRSYFYGASDWNKLEYNPGLGQWVKGGSKERARICKERGLIEVGNEDPDKVAKYQDDKLNTILEDNWSKV